MSLRSDPDKMREYKRLWAKIIESHRENILVKYVNK